MKAWPAHLVQEGDEPVVKACDIEQRAGLRMVPELRPGPDFEQLFERPDTAGHGNEPVGQFGHQGLALVHRADHPQVRQTIVGDFLGGQCVWNDADHMATSRQRRIGDPRP